MFRKKFKRDPYPPWLKWVFIFFALFAMLSYHKEGKEGAPNPLRKAVNKASQDMNPTEMFDYESYSQKVLPNYQSTLRINDVKLGSGLPAVCGQEVTVSYEAWLGESEKLGEASKEKPLRFVVGESNVMPALEQGVIGMQPGGTRSLLAPMPLSYGTGPNKREDIAPSANIQFRLTLHDAKPPLPDPNIVPYRVHVTQRGSGKRFICGMEVAAHIVVWDMRGKKLFSSYDKGEPIIFTLGKATLPIGLEQGTVGMRGGEMRTMIVPPSFQKPQRDVPQLINFDLPENETIIIDVALLP